MHAFLAIGISWLLAPLLPLALIVGYLRYRQRRIPRAYLLAAAVAWVLSSLSPVCMCIDPFQQWLGDTAIFMFWALLSLLAAAAVEFLQHPRPVRTTQQQ
jgi:hypothetical protein